MMCRVMGFVIRQMDGVLIGGICGILMMRLRRAWGRRLGLET